MLEKTQAYFFFGLLALIAIVSFLIALPYLPAITFAAALAIVFTPWYKKLTDKFDRPRLAAWLTLLTVGVIVIIPFSLIGVQVIREATDLYHRIQDGGLNELPAGPLVNSFLTRISPSLAGNSEETLKQALGWTISKAGGIFAGTFTIFLNIFIGAMSLFYFLVDGPRIRKVALVFSPLPDKYDEIILNRLANTMTSVIRGSLVIAMIQGTLAGLGFLIFGVPNPALWGLITAFSALIPGVGTALILIPASAFLFLTGNTTGGIGLLVWASLAVGLIDNFLGPRLVNRGVNIHPLAIFISVLGGLSFFGPLGFLMGPLVMSLFFTLLDIYGSFSKTENLKKSNG